MNSTMKKKRKCNTCGTEFVSRYGSHKKWCVVQKKPVYCGTGRVIR